jgi:hypothetical protein
MVVASRHTPFRVAAMLAALMLLATLAEPVDAMSRSRLAPSAPEVVLAADGSFDALPDHGAVADAVGVFPLTNCPAPPNAGDWTAQVVFAQGGNSRVSFQDYVVNSAGNWGGTFTIPIGAQPGAATLTATCFDSTHTTPTIFSYASFPFTVDSSTFAAAAGGPPGGSLAVHDVGPCPAPAGATSWTVVLHMGQGANAIISSSNLVVNGSGHWSGAIRIPYGVTPGAAQVTASCFDAAHATQVSLDYQAVPFTVTVPTFTVAPTSNAAGSLITVSGDSPCPAPAGASAWTALVRFAQGSNPALSFHDFAVGPTGAWGGSFTVPPGALPGAAQLTASCFDAAHVSATQLDYAPVPFTVVIDTTAPVLHLPANRTVSATGPAGAAVRFVASATDTQDPSPVVACRPASGSTFRIATTTVACTATDLAGNAAQGQFTVKVLGAVAQLSSLITRVQGDHLRASLTRSLVGDLSAARSALTAHARTRACADVATFVRAVRAATGHGITSAQASILVTAGGRIRAVVSC